MVKQKISLAWMQHSAFTATLLAKGVLEILAENDICFSKDGRFTRNIDKANPLQKKIGEILQNLEYDRFPLIRKVVFNKSGITIFRTHFKTWEIGCAKIETQLAEIFKEEKIEMEFINDIEEFKEINVTTKKVKKSPE